MMFLIRATFWLTIVLILLPGDPEHGADAPRVSILQALAAVRATVVDLSQFCDRNPDVCSTGSSVAQAAVQKARYGVRQLEEYFGGDGEPAGTLRPEDLVVPWQEPAPRRDGTV
jgi:hypothetical protein